MSEKLATPRTKCCGPERRISDESRTQWLPSTLLSSLLLAASKEGQRMRHCLCLAAY